MSDPQANRRHVAVDSFAIGDSSESSFRLVYSTHKAIKINAT